MKDYYKILMVSPTASEEEIKKAYRKLAHLHHPDKGGDPEKFKEISEAYQVLSNKDKRVQYDRYGRVFEQGGTAPGFDFGDFWRQYQYGGGQGADEGPDIDFDFGFGDLGDIFEEFFGGGGRRQKGGRKSGQDIEVDIEISLESTLKNFVKEFEIYKWVPCSRCQGRGGEPGTSLDECFTCRGKGEVQQIKRSFLGTVTRYVVCPECGGEGNRPKVPCNVCRGEGRLKEKDKISVAIPAGVDSGQTIRVPGKGEAGKRGGQSGDLFVKIYVKEHPVFKREGDDLHLSREIPLTTAILGAEIEIPTLEGKNILLKVPSGSESGDVFRIQGRGVPHFSGIGQGNLYIELRLATPKKLNRKQKELLESLRREGL